MADEPFEVNFNLLPDESMQAAAELAALEKARKQHAKRPPTPVLDKIRGTGSVREAKPVSPNKPRTVKFDDIQKYKSDRDLVQEAKELIEDNISQMKSVVRQLSKLTR